jgi:hypothetical protein
MPMYVVSVGSVLMMRIVGLFAMGVVMVFAVVMPRRHPSIVMAMDVWVISSTVTMVNRAHGSKSKLFLLAAAAAISSSPALIKYVAYAHCGFIRLPHGSRACARAVAQPLAPCKFGRFARRRTRE